MEGDAVGTRISKDRWAHSPTWSKTGQCMAYVVNEGAGSWIVHLDLASGRESRLGVPGAINVLPRFDRAGDDEAVLFCSGSDWRGPFRIYRQAVSDPEPTALSPEGADCLFPLYVEGPSVVCARVAGEHLNWVQASPGGTTDLAVGYGIAGRPRVLQTLAGIAQPVSPDGRSFLFYDGFENRIAVHHGQKHRTVRHRTGSIAACWLSPEAIALASEEGVFAVNTVTGLSPALFDGPWIPARYVDASRTLFLLGREGRSRLSIVEVVFKPRPVDVRDVRTEPAK